MSQNQQVAALPHGKTGQKSAIGSIHSAFNRALKSEPPAARARGQAVSAMLALYERCPNVARPMLLADLDAFEEARR